MRKTTIVCECGGLADVVDKTIVPHESDGKPCARSGARYVPSRGKSADRGPQFLGSVEIPCPICHEQPIAELSLFGQTTKEWVN